MTIDAKDAFLCCEYIFVFLFSFRKKGKGYPLNLFNKINIAHRVLCIRERLRPLTKGASVSVLNLQWGIGHPEGSNMHNC